MTDYSLYKKLRFDLSGNIGIGTNRPQAKVDISGNVQVLGHVTPSVSLNYDLGSTTKRWRDIYLSGNTIDLGGTLISKEANGGIKIADNLGNTLDGKFNNLVINGAINQATRLDVSGSILPTRNLVYDLGAPDKRWNDLYLSGNTIDLSGTLLSRHVDGSFMVHDSNNNMISGRFADVTATGNIGVGTDHPLYKMHVIGDTRIQGNLMVNGTTTVVDTNVNTTEMLEITNDGTGPALRVTQTGVQPIADFCDDASNNVVVRIADSGNVGIGTLTPQTKLHVIGTVRVDGDVSANIFNGKLKWTDVSGAPPYELPIGSVVVYDGIAQLDSSFVPADGQTLNRIDYPELANALNIPGNQVTFTVPTPSEYQPNWNDISTSSVSYIRNKPNVYGDENGNVDVSGNIKLKDGSVSNPVLTFSNDLNTGFYRAGNDILGFVTGGSERMRIDASGNIGIGTSIPTVGLHVNKTIRVNNSNENAFPPATIMSYVTDISGTSYGAGKYMVSSSTEFNTSNVAWYAFDKNNSNTWTSIASYSTSTPYGYSNTIKTLAISGTSYAGDWLQIQLPVSIIVTNITITCVGIASAPKLFYLLGSLNGNNWTLISTQSNVTWTSSFQTLIFNVTTSSAYTYYRIVTNQVFNNASYVQISEWILNGTMESINISTDGELGIGVRNPIEMLEVAGNAIFYGNISAGNLGMFRNRIINGDMTINQRVSGNVSTNNQNMVDRWVYYTDLAGGSVQQTTVSVNTADIYVIEQGFRSYIKCSRGNSAFTSGYGMQITQNIEMYNVMDIMPTICTVSFYARGSSAGNIRVIMGKYINNVNYTYIEESVNISTTWNRYVVTCNLIVPITSIVSNALNGQGIQLTIRNTYMPLNSSFDITGVQLEKGSIATPFEFRPITVELQLCQRYYEKSYAYNTAPGTATTVECAHQRLVVTGSYTYIFPHIYFKVSKRDVPTITVYSTSTGATGVWYNDRAGNQVVNYANDPNSKSINGFWPYLNTAYQLGDGIFFHWVSSSEV